MVINDLSRGGAETQLVQLAVGLDRARWEPAVVLLSRRNDFADMLAGAGVLTIALGQDGWCDVFVLLRLLRVLRRLRPDVVHTSLYLANLYGVLAARLARTPHVVVSQRCSYESNVGPVRRRIARLGHRLADRVIVNSRAALEEECAAGMPADRLVHVPNGVALEASAVVDRAALGLPDGPLVLAVGRLEAVKGHRVLLDAWPIVSRAVPDASLVLLGEGVRRGALESQARRLGVSSRVRFLGFRGPALPYVAACAVFVQPSLSEGMPNSVLEAMAAGKPIVASRVGGIPEMLVDGENGLLVPPGDTAALAMGLTRLLEDPPFRERLGAAARARAERDFSLAALRAATERIYCSLDEGR
jgi:glycosyltransferase involved in cell wall biosynthesis